MREIFAIAVDALNGFLEDDGWAIASHIALATLTSMFPFLIFLTAISGLFGSKQLADQAATLLLQAWPHQAAEPISREIHNVLTEPRTGLVTLGVVLCLYFSSSGIEALRIGLNRAYRVRERRPWWLLRLESIVYVMIAAIALLAVTVVVVLGPLLWSTVLAQFHQLARLNQLLRIFGYSTTTVLLSLALIIAHKWLPAERHSLAQIAPGVILTLALSLLTAIAFGYYLNEFAHNYVTTYAGLASFMIALLFLYALASIFVFGGELNASINRRKRLSESR